MSTKRAATSPAQTEDSDKRQCMDDLNVSMELLSDNSNENLLKKIKELVEQESLKIVDKFSQQISQLKDEIAAKDIIIAKLEQRLDNQEQHGRQNNIRISGIPETENEITDNLVLEVTKSIGADIDINDICRDHRLGPKKAGETRNIIVRFATYRAKRQVNNNKKHLKGKKLEEVFPSMNWASNEGSVYVNDDLTKRRAMLFYEARKKWKKDEIEGTWISNGRIMIKKTETSTPVAITSKNEFDELFQ